jgi:hypothetical protein
VEDVRHLWLFAPILEIRTINLACGIGRICGVPWSATFLLLDASADSSPFSLLLEFVSNIVVSLWLGGVRELERLMLLALLGMIVDWSFWNKARLDPVLSCRYSLQMRLAIFFRYFVLGFGSG